jgi:hypothetical protein
MTKISFIVQIIIVGLVAAITFAISLSVPGIQASAVAAYQQPNILHHMMMNHTGSSHNPQSLTSVQSGATRGKFFSANGISLVKGVRITNISQVADDHLIVNLNYTGDGSLPGISIIAFANDSLAVVNRIMTGEQNSTMMKIMNGSQQGMMTMMKEGGQQKQQVQNSTVFDGSSSTSIPIEYMHSGSNYLESGWPGAKSNTATVLVQINGSIGSGHVMVMAVPLLHH